MTGSFDRSKFKRCGEDVFLGDPIVLRYPELIEIGDHVAIDPFVYISTAMRVGSYVHIAPMVSIIGGRESSLILEDFAGLAAGCRIVCGSDDFVRGTGLTNPTVPGKYHGKILHTTVVIERHALLGTNCVVLPGVRIGQGAVAGACALIKADMDPWTIYVGNPARAVGKRRSRTILEREEQLWNELQAGSLGPTGRTSGESGQDDQS